MVMIKNNNVKLVFCIFMLVTPVLADHASELCIRLSQVNSFYARFTQKIIDSTGVLLQENKGELWIRRPNCFNYHVLYPEEFFLISNGKILWFYDLSINQVIISWLKDIIDDACLMLLTYNSEFNWNSKYYITQDIKNIDTFFLIPKKNQNVYFKKIEINITTQGIIRKINFFNKGGNNIDYILTHYQKGVFDVNKFNFLTPDGVNIDEQRW